MSSHVSVLRRYRLWIRYIDRWSERLLIAGLLVAALFVFTTHLGNVSLRDWDEGTVAQVAKEIWRSPSGSLTWLYPTLQGEPYLNKPPLMHVLIAFAYHLGGVNEWTSRLPGAILTAISVPFLYGIGREMFGGRSPALIAALVYLTFMPVVRHGRLAMLDGACLCFFLIALWCLLRSRRDPRWALGVGIGLGLVCLTKGLLGVLLGAIALGFLAWDSPRLLTSLYLWNGIFIGGSPVLAWYGAQWIHYGDAFVGTHVMTQSLDRVWTSVENHQGPPWYYLLELVKYGWPWLIFLPHGVAIALQNRTLSWAKLVLVWLGGYFLVISVMATKLPWYIMPIYPAIALATAVPLCQVWQQSSVLSNGEKPDPHYARGWLVLSLLLAGLGWLGWGYFAFVSDPSEQSWQFTLGLFAMTMTASSLLMVRQNRQFLAVMLWGTYLTITCLVMSPHWVWELAEDYPVKPVAELVQANTPPDAVIYTSHPYNRPSLNFYSDRQVMAVSEQRLRRAWDREVNAYFLMDAQSLQRLHWGTFSVLGTNENWVLMTHFEQLPDPESPINQI
jgi:4-amino-4-deoxy-L-arabinose transferase-like glycosyltransferase